MYVFKNIKTTTKLPVEIFAHGAHCVSYSGNCLMSGLIGYRSGNRGRCVGSCRKPYELINLTTNESLGTSYILSMKDLATIEVLKDLDFVDSLKIEGRMKRPEYVAASVRACRQALDDGIVDFETKDMLRSVFARSGFTDGYYMGKLGSDMFGKREKEDVISANESLFKKIRSLYNKEAQLIPLKMQFKAISDELMSLSITDDFGNTAFVEEAPPEKAEKSINVTLSGIVTSVKFEQL
mgnify:CR=1 FL=1